MKNRLIQTVAVAALISGSLSGTYAAFMAQHNPSAVANPRKSAHSTLGTEYFRA